MYNLRPLANLWKMSSLKRSLLSAISSAIEMLVLHGGPKREYAYGPRQLRHAPLVLGKLGGIVPHDWRAIPFSASSLMKSVSRATKASSIFRLNGGCANCSRLRTNTLH
jgi:hypothetical protein